METMLVKLITNYKFSTNVKMHEIHPPFEVSITIARPKDILIESRL